MKPVETVLQFIEAINRQDVERLANLMSANHIFIDAGGEEYRGRDRTRQGWSGYFGMFPDYQVVVQETFSRGGTVVVLGTAAGTYAPGGRLRSENRWEVPAAWRAIVEAGHIALWQVYADNEPVREIMSKSGD